MSLLENLEKKFGKITFPYLLPILLAGQVMVYLAVVSESISFAYLPLNSSRVMAGELWRVITFMLVPMQMNPLFFALFIWITYIMGSALEGEWGEFRFGVYIGSCWLATVLGSFLVPYAVLSNTFIFGNLVIAFAWLFPNFEIRLFFILPVKVKYIGYVYWALYALELVGGTPGSRVSVLAALVPVFLFFGKEMRSSVKQRQRASTYRKNVKQEAGTPFHICAYCGNNDLKNPDLDFRYLEGKCICEQCRKERNIR
ncbi:MAG: hypothetical protein ACO3N7_04600 [Kiritimatiellia bacterium]